MEVVSVIFNRGCGSAIDVDRSIVAAAAVVVVRIGQVNDLYV